MGNDRIHEIDILKGIGILSVVCGHSFGFVIPVIQIHSLWLINTYQIFVFLFTSGGTYRPGQSYKTDMGKRIVSLAAYNFLYNLLFVLMHNGLIRMGVLDAVRYRKADLLEKIINGVQLDTAESMLGAFWFIPMLLFAMVFFIGFWRFAEARKHKLLWHILCIAGSIGIGYGIRHYALFDRVGHHMMISFLGVPVIYAGKLFFTYKEKSEKALTWYGMLAALVIIVLSIKQKQQIALSVYVVPDPLWFYGITICGIYGCLYVTKWIVKSALLTKWMSVVGKNSLHIMALHFLSFKAVDLLLIGCGLFDAHRYPLNGYPTSGLPIGFAYVLAGTLLPLGAITVVKLLKKWCQALNWKRISGIQCAPGAD